MDSHIIPILEIEPMSVAWQVNTIITMLPIPPFYGESWLTHTKKLTSSMVTWGIFLFTKENSCCKVCGWLDMVPWLITGSDTVGFSSITDRESRADSRVAGVDLDRSPTRSGRLLVSWPHNCKQKSSSWDQVFLGIYLDVQQNEVSCTVSPNWAWVGWKNTNEFVSLHKFSQQLAWFGHNKKHKCICVAQCLSYCTYNLFSPWFVMYPTSRYTTIPVHKTDRTPGSPKYPSKWSSDPWRSGLE